MLKLKADTSMRKAGSSSEASQRPKEEEVVMGTNQAYETVGMRYQSASRSWPPAEPQEQNTTEEPVYENH